MFSVLTSTVRVFERRPAERTCSSDDSVKLSSVTCDKLAIELIWWKAMPSSTDESVKISSSQQAQNGKGGQFPPPGYCTRSDSRMFSFTCLIRCNSTAVASHASVHPCNMIFAVFGRAISDRKSQPPHMPYCAPPVGRRWVAFLVFHSQVALETWSAVCNRHSRDKIDGQRNRLTDTGHGKFAAHFEITLIFRNHHDFIRMWILRQLFAKFISNFIFWPPIFQFFRQPDHPTTLWWCTFVVACN